MPRGSWMIEGTWSGYTRAQSRVVHREYTRSKKHAEAVAALGSILYTDNTKLLLSVSRRDGNRDPEIDSYGSLIRDCVRHGVSRVDDLPSEA